jgi:hypothetical protein
MTEKVADEIILFPEANVEGIIVRPWTFGVLLDVNPFLEAIFEKIEAKGIKFDGFMLGFTEIKELYFAAAPQLLKVLSFTTGKSEDDIRNLDLKVVLRLIYVIWQQNQANLKNVFGLFSQPVNKEETVETES